MNKWEKEVQQSLLSSEADTLKELERQYKTSMNSVMDKIKVFDADIRMIDNVLLEEGLDEGARSRLLSMRQSKVYQKQYQQSLQAQIGGILDNLQGQNYSTIESYLRQSYTDAFIGTMYNISGQGIPIIAPIDQTAVTKAVLLDSKISTKTNSMVGALYTALGVDNLKKKITQEVSRGIATGMSYADMARNLNNAAGTGYSNASRIVRTEGHRIQQAATYDAQHKAKDKGADVVKQWDSALDGRTRTTHRQLDGQIREIDEPFEVGGRKVDRPGYFGDPAEDCNCRCACTTRARWALDEAELQTLKERAAFFGLDKTKDFEDFNSKYIKTVAKKENLDIISTKALSSKVIDGKTVVNPMDADKYRKLCDNLENHGIYVVQAEGDDLKFLQSIGAEATYGNGYIMHIDKVPSASGMFEEIIHSSQAKKYGELTDSNPIEMYAREIAANRKLLKHGKAYGFDNQDFEDIEKNLDSWEERFKKRAGVSYDESDYSREI